PAPAAATAGLAGVKVDARDPLAVLLHGKTSGAVPRPAPIDPDAPAGTVVVRAPMHGTGVGVDVAPGDAVPAGGQLLVMEAMKMEHVVTARVGGIVRTVAVRAGDTVYEGSALIVIEESAVEATAGGETGAVDP